MLRVGLWGSLTEHLDQFNKTLDPSVYRCCPILSERENAQLDLILYLQEDRESSKKQPLQSAIVQHPLARAWEEICSPGELEMAIQNSLFDVYGFIVGTANQVHVACKWIRSVAHQASSALDLRALIVGETGTGKELIASAIHKLSPRRNDPFVAVNCAALPHELIGAELFGHKRGAFTGAVQDREGGFSAARRGVVFLDEIGELPLETQTVLLRVLERRVFSPIGSNLLVPLEAQVISATNILIAEAVEKKTFRPDLYFRLAQITIELPPVRERRRDIPILVQHFLRLNNKSTVELSDLPLAELQSYDWPGNIRELRVAIERYILLSSMGGHVSIEEWLPAVRAARPTAERSGTLAALRNEFDKKVLQAVLVRCNGDTASAARELGISRRSVYNLASRHGVDLKQNVGH